MLILLQHNFNSHAREGRDLPILQPAKNAANFNSHAREGRDFVNSCSVFRRSISTHTPVRGVTLRAVAERAVVVISTHTPVRGVTLCLQTASCYPTDFNSHAREGRDRPHSCFRSCSAQNFNSHAREGRDALRQCPDRWYKISTHTPVRGVTTYRPLLTRYF